MQLSRMRLRRTLLCIPVIAFLTCTLLGLHSHLGGEHPHAGAPHQAHSSYPAMELSSVHLAEHLTDDDVDVDNTGMVPAKAALPAVFLIAVFCCFLLLVAPSRRTSVVRTAERPLRPPRRPYLQPPSQAPPCSA